MKVLLADDDVGVRSVLKRMLYSLHCTTVEADNGVEALEIITSTPVALAIIDLEMPLLGGIDVLQAIRSSRTHASLPVIILSGTTDRHTAAEIVAMGVTDFLAKPFRFDWMKQRLLGVVQALKAAGPRAPRRVAAAAPAASSGPRPVLIVDSNADFRYFVETALAPMHPTLHATSGQEAVVLCATRQPLAVIVGLEVGIFGPAQLSRKLRSQPELAGTRLVLAAAPDQAAPVAEAGAFDAVIPRTFVPQEFVAQFRQALGRKLSFDEPDTALALVRSTIVSATEQAMGMIAHTDVRVASEGRVAPEAGHIVADVVLRMFKENTDVHIALSCSQATAGALAARMLQIAEADLAEEDRQSVVGEFTNVIAGRIQTAVADQWGNAKFTLPKIGTIDADATRDTPDLSFQFEAPGQDISLVVALAASDSASGGPV